MTKIICGGCEVSRDSCEHEGTFFPRSFNTILADPPWNETGGGKRGAQNHYPLIKTRQAILYAMIQSGAFNYPWAGRKNQGPTQHLWLWTTSTFLPDALWLMDALGFTYKNNPPWIKMKNGKLQTGIGQYFRGSHENIIFGTRGKAMVPSTKDRKSSVFIDERTQTHSEKPASIHERAELISPGPRIELFARKARPGWYAWGNEI